MRTHAIPEQAGEPIAVFRSAEPLKAQPAYTKAKAGDADAAIDLVGDLAGPLIDNTAKFGADVIYVAPHAIKATGDNAIPQTLAAYIARSHGARLDYSIVQLHKKPVTSSASGMLTKSEIAQLQQRKRALGDYAQKAFASKK